jgi:carboxypeptidase T
MVDYSKKLVTFLALSLILFSQTAISKNDFNGFFEKDWKILGSIKTENMHNSFRLLRELDIDVAGVDIDNKIIDVLLSDIDLVTLNKYNYQVEIVEVKGVTAKPDQEYKNPSEIESLLNDFHNRYPAITELKSIGKSVEGRDIWAIKISDYPHLHEVHEPAILFNSMHHAREIMTPEVSLDIIEYLLSGYQQNEQTTEWIDANEIWVIPMFNVDGNNKMWLKDKWWRKNTQGGHGVDLNRNYPAGWNSCKGSSGRRSSQTYRGPRPASEPETQAMMSFIQEVRPVFDISYHSYSELVIYPLGCGDKKTSNKEVVEKIGKQIATKLNYKAGTAWELLYNADGGDIDWMYEAFQVIPYVIELNSRSQGFHPKFNKWREKTVIRNRAGWQHLLERLSLSGVRGQVVKNTIAVSDFTIDIFKLNSNLLLQRYVGHQTGMYHLVLNPGEYKLVFKNKLETLKTEFIDIQENLKEVNITL